MRATATYDRKVPMTRLSKSEPSAKHGARANEKTPIALRQDAKTIGEA